MLFVNLMVISVLTVGAVGLKRAFPAQQRASSILLPDAAAISRQTRSPRSIPCEKGASLTKRSEIGPASEAGCLVRGPQP